MKYNYFPSGGSLQTWETLQVAWLYLCKIFYCFVHGFWINIKTDVTNLVYYVHFCYIIPFLKVTFKGLYVIS